MSILIYYPILISGTISHRSTFATNIGGNKKKSICVYSIDGYRIKTYFPVFFFFGSSNLKIYFITRFILCKYTKPRSTVILCSNLNTIVTLVFLQKIVRVIDASRITNFNNPGPFAIYILTLLRLYCPSLRVSLSYFCIYILGRSPPPLI